MEDSKEELYIKVIKGKYVNEVFQVKNMSDSKMTLEISNSKISRTLVDIEDVTPITKEEFYNDSQEFLESQSSSFF